MSKWIAPKVSTTLSDDDNAVSGEAMSSKINDSGWITIGTGVSARKKNGYVTISGTSSNLKELTGNAYTSVGTLPEGFYPDNVQHFNADNYGGNLIIYGRIERNEVDIKMYSSETTSYWEFSFTYPVSD